MDPKRTREALAELGLIEECENPECERGLVHDGFDGLHNKQVECPSCKGRGFSLNQERLGRGKDAVVPEFYKGSFKSMAKAAILAYLLEGPNGD